MQRIPPAKELWAPIETALNGCADVVRGGDTKMTLIKNKLQWYRYLDPYLNSPRTFQLGQELLALLEQWLGKYLLEKVVPSLDGNAAEEQSGESSSPTPSSSSQSSSFLIFRTMQEYTLLAAIAKFCTTIFTSLEDVLRRRSHVVPVEERARRIFAKMVLRGTVTSARAEEQSSTESSSYTTAVARSDIMLGECFGLLNNKRRLGIEHVDEVRAAAVFYISLVTAQSSSLLDAQIIFQRRFFDGFMSSTAECLAADSTARLTEPGGVQGYVSYAKFRMGTETAIASQLVSSLPVVCRNEVDNNAPAKRQALLKNFQGVARTALVDRHCEALVSDLDYGVKALLTDGRKVELGLLFSLICDVPKQVGINACRKELFEFGLEKLSAMKKAYECAEVSAQGGAGATTDDQSIQYVYGVLSTHVSLVRLASTMLGNTKELLDAIAEAVKSVFDTAPKRRAAPTPTSSTFAAPSTIDVHPADLLSAFVDVLMKGDLEKKHPSSTWSSGVFDISSSSSSMDAADALINGAASLLNVLSEKDVFQEYCRSRLAKRLLQSSSGTSSSSSSSGNAVDDELETRFLQKLQSMLGKNYTHQMERMLGDIEATRSLCEAFKNDTSGFYGRVTNVAKVGQFNVTVLKVGDWPTFKTGGLTPPSNLAECIDAFTQFYRRDNPLRRLNWCFTLGTGVASVRFATGTKEITGTIQQVSILCLLDNATDSQLSVKEATESLGLTGDAGLSFAKSLFHSMANLSQKFSILRKLQDGPANDEAGVAKPKEKKSTTVPPPPSANDRFAIDKKFTVSVRRFKLPGPKPLKPSSSSAAGDGSSGAPSAEQKARTAQRNASIDASIVRVMKSRRRLSFPELAASVMQQVSRLFPADSKQIKMRTEELITRAYLKRDEGDSAVLEYLA